MKDEDKAWLEYRTRFSELYDNSNYPSPLQSSIIPASYRLVEKPFDALNHPSLVLEIGADLDEHLSFVKHTFDKYILSDHDSKTLDVANNKINGKFESKVAFEIQTGNNLTYLKNTFDRLVAVHILEHIYQPHLVVKKWLRVLTTGGVQSFLIPTDPGLAWRLGWHLGPRKMAIKQGIAYGYVMVREHVNLCTNLIAILRHYFPDRKEGWWPFPMASTDLNLFFAFNTTVNK